MEIKEDYCNFETAKLLKEKGFDVYTPTRYDYDGGFHSHGDYLIGDSDISAPTYQMAMKWLMEVHNKYCDISYDIDLEWYFQIVDLKETVEYGHSETKYYHTGNETGFNTYEEAVEAALKYSLENLI